MDGRAVVGTDIEVGRIKSRKGYDYADTIRGGVNVGSLGLGAGQIISKNTSLTTAITVEGFCSVISLAVAVHEIVEICGLQCCRRDGRIVESTNYTPAQHSLYITFRIAANLSSLIGVALIALDLAVDTTTMKTTVGIALMTIGAFASRTLSGSTQKPTGTVLVADDNAMEQGRLAPRSARSPAAHAVLWQHRRAEQSSHLQPANEDDSPIEMEPAHHVPVVQAVEARVAPRQNQFFQDHSAANASAPQPAANPSGPEPVGPKEAPLKKGWKKVKAPRKSR